VCEFSSFLNKKQLFFAPRQSLRCKLLIYARILDSSSFRSIHVIQHYISRIKLDEKQRFFPHFMQGETWSWLWLVFIDEWPCLFPVAAVDWSSFLKLPSESSQDFYARHAPGSSRFPRHSLVRTQKTNFR